MKNNTGETAEAVQPALWRSERHNEYHFRQYREPYRSTLFLQQRVRSIITDCSKCYRVADVGCGAGANIYHLSDVLPNSRWLGIDLATELLAEAKKVITSLGRPRIVDFISADFFQLSRFLPVRHFDLVFSIQTLSWIPDYENLLSQLLMILAPGGWAFVTSLFSDFLVDASIQVTQYAEANLAPEGPFFYNVYCLDRFISLCKQHGASTVLSWDFAIDCDLEPPSHRHMGTYTQKLGTGERLQFSGPLYLPWKVVAIKMGDS